MKKYLECCKIINKRGINGELKADCYCDAPSSLFGVKTLYGNEDGAEAFDVISIKEYKGFLYIKLKGVDSAETADSMREKILYALRNDIKKNSESVFIADLIGLDVIDYATGQVYGKISEVSNYGASDIYTVKNGAKTYMIPAVKDIICKIDIEKCVYVKPIPGLFDDAEEIR